MKKVHVRCTAKKKAHTSTLYCCSCIFGNSRQIFRHHIKAISTISSSRNSEEAGRNRYFNCPSPGRHGGFSSFLLRKRLFLLVTRSTHRERLVDYARSLYHYKRNQKCTRLLGMQVQCTLQNELLWLAPRPPRQRNLKQVLPDFAARRVRRVWAWELPSCHFLRIMHVGWKSKELQLEVAELHGR